MRNHESEISTHERRFIRMMLHERVREVFPDKSIPPGNDPVTGKPLSPDNYHCYKPLLDLLKDAANNRYPHVWEERSRNYHETPRSRRRVTIKAGEEDGEARISVSSSQMKLFFKGSDPSRYDDAEEGGITYRNSLLNGLYLCFSNGRFTRRAYLDRYPHLFTNTPDQFEQLFFQVRLVMGVLEGEINGEELQKRVLTTLYDYNYQETLAGEIMVHHAELFYAFASLKSTLSYPHPFLVALQKFVHVEKAHLAERYHELNEAFEKRKHDLEAIEEEIWKKKHHLEDTDDWGILDRKRDLGVFQDHLEVMIRDEISHKDEARRALALLDHSRRLLPQLKGFSFLDRLGQEQSKIPEYSLLIQSRMRSGLKYRYYAVYNFRPGARVNVWLCYDVLENEFAVVKELAPGQLLPHKEERFRNELNRLRELHARTEAQAGSATLSHRLVSVMDEGKDWFVMEYIQGGDLAHRLRPQYYPQQASNPALPLLFDLGNPFPNSQSAEGWPSFRDFMADIADTISLLHDYHLAHREIHPGNILLQPNPSQALRAYTPVLCDLDRMVEFDHQIPDSQILPGKSEFDPPERLDDGKAPIFVQANRKIDVYSLAALLVYHLSGRNVSGEPVAKILREGHFHPTLRRLLGRALSPEPHQRPSAREFSHKLRDISKPLAKRKRLQLVLMGILLPLTLGLGFLFGSALWTTENPLRDHYFIIDQHWVDSHTAAGQPIHLEKRHPDEKPYLMTGWVVIDSGQTLIIDPGTVIQFDSVGSLLIRPDAQLIAQGTRQAPILFTDQLTQEDTSTGRPGSWGGLIVMGRAPVFSPNTRPGDRNGTAILEFCSLADGRSEICRFGGTNPEDRSGVLEYIIIENAGQVVTGNHEINPLNFAGVGNETVAQNIVVRNSNDDGVEIFGGTVTIRDLHLVDIRDDGLDLEWGFCGQIERVFYAQTGLTDFPLYDNWEHGFNVVEANHIGTPEGYNDTLPFVMISEVVAIDYAEPIRGEATRIITPLRFDNPHLQKKISIQIDSYLPADLESGVLPISPDWPTTSFSSDGPAFLVPEQVKKTFFQWDWSQMAYRDTVRGL